MNLIASKTTVIVECHAMWLRVKQITKFIFFNKKMQLIKIEAFGNFQKLVNAKSSNL